MGAAPDCSGGAHLDDDDEGVGMVVGGPRCWLPGFRFHPTDEELVLYYLKRKICGRRVRPRMIGDVDVYKWEPWELPEKSVLRSGDKQWYYFSPRDRKYPNGSRSNRATKHGYWKATGKDRTILQNSKPAGNKKTLVYYHGRAPKGERTDWVMHEYTLDEQVLMSCTSVQDSFALYKLFRKSGPGPKNGEQYGAPFKEEEWEVDDVQDDYFGNQFNREDTPTEHLDNHSVDRALIVNVEQNTLPNYALENILLQMSSDLDLIPGDPNCYSYAPESYNGVNGVSDIADPLSYRDATFPQLSGASCEHGNEITSFVTALSPSAAYVLPNIETPEVMPLTSCLMQAQLEGIEEFLEIKDFNNSDSVVHSFDNIINNDLIHMNNDLVDPDDYFDAQMFLAEAMGDGISPPSYWGDSGFNDTQFEASDLTTQLWTHEQVPNGPTAVELNQIGLASSASSGLLYGSGSQSDLGGVIQENVNYVSSPSESWFGSALSAFLDSVPSGPALASENALINRALTRVSSFTAGHIQRDGGPVRRHGGQNGGFLFVSFLVGLGAIFWFLIIGVVIKVFKGFWGRFISS